MAKTLKMLMVGLPEEIQLRFETRFLKPLFGLLVEDLLPGRGTRFNSVSEFPWFPAAKKIITK